MRNERTGLGGRAMRALPRIVFVASRAISVVCLVVLGGAAAFDGEVERFTAGRLPAQFAGQLVGTSDLAANRRVTVVAHNAGDDLQAATRAIAYGADAIEIDVRAAGGTLFASHDMPVPLLKGMVSRSPSLEAAWDVAALRDTVLLHLKQHSARYVRQVRAFVAKRPLRRVIVQTADLATLRQLEQTLPSVQRLLLVFNRRQLEDLRHAKGLGGVLDGVSARENVLSREAQAWLERRGLRTFAWSVNDERRVRDLVHQGVDGIITDRLDIMRALGDEGPVRQ